MPMIKAIVNKSPGVAEIQDVPVPQLRDGFILIRVHAIALNPTDWKGVAYGDVLGLRVGCDYAGVVEAVGNGVDKPFAVGDRVAGLVHGSNDFEKEDGAFAEVIAARSHLAIKIPERVSFEEAATLGVGITTIGQALYQSLGLPLPSDPASSPFPLLVYGGSTATGTLAIQFAKLSGLTVVTTCSPRNFELVKSLGADAVFDYRSPTCASDIKAYTRDSLAHVFDCISEGDSTDICVNAIGSAGGVYSTLLDLNEETIKSLPSKVKWQQTVAYTATGVDSEWGPASEKDKKHAEMFWELARELLEQGKIKVHRPRLNLGGKGLEGAIKGMEELKSGKVSGVKLVYQL